MKSKGEKVSARAVGWGSLVSGRVSWGGATELSDCEELGTVESEGPRNQALEGADCLLQLALRC